MYGAEQASEAKRRSEGNAPRRYPHDGPHSVARLSSGVERVVICGVVVEPPG